MSAAHLSESRDNKRFDCKIAATVRSLDRGAPTGDSYLESKRSLPTLSACNLSLEGLCMISDETMDPGEVLRLELKIPGSDKTIPALGEVCWSKGGRTGIKLLSVTEAGKNQMRRYFMSLKSSTK